jgi:hypothetical protein
MFLKKEEKKIHHSDPNQPPMGRWREATCLRSSMKKSFPFAIVLAAVINIRD